MRTKGLCLQQVPSLTESLQENVLQRYEQLRFLIVGLLDHSYQHFHSGKIKKRKEKRKEMTISENRESDWKPRKIGRKLKIVIKNKFSGINERKRLYGYSGMVFRVERRLVRVHRAMRVHENVDEPPRLLLHFRGQKDTGRCQILETHRLTVPSWICSVYSKRRVWHNQRIQIHGLKLSQLTEFQ